VRDVTELLKQWNDGHAEARDQVVALLYAELKKLARRSLKSERTDHTLQPTALVNELYEKLVDQRSVRWQGRAHFFAVASSLMRRILVDHARRKKAARRGGGTLRVEIGDGAEGAVNGPDVDMIALDAALEDLERLDANQARLVELRFFGGLATEEAAGVLGVSRATADRDWSMARAWLHTRLVAT
jgi:RNA polymerase sigma-70 factor (ECF subfamily)